ncbi:6-phospho-3-hexuloisomerase [Halobacillus litoralis]|uniref:6-phospho-3-hexuloisomerase n=1 Tax=Halobacillus litoralis TaxID=45668 RepID=UPI001CD57CF9|nr:6-phospho-3-hexuloisomerase [Halobacillus litoralis]MCA0972154.1 6-phospho-3-hexuloisomerase [Halobacillus litoralis]
MKETMQTVVREIDHVLSQISEQEATDLSKELLKAKRIFVTGEGRSGFMGKAAAMRLMHGGFDVYVTGETITPSIAEGDLLLAISGSGTTTSILHQVESAKKASSRVALVTTNPDSPIGRESDVHIQVPAATKKRLAHEPETIQPLGNQFDQTVHLLLDAIIIYTLQHGSSLTHDEMTANHANME